MRSAPAFLIEQRSLTRNSYFPVSTAASTWLIHQSGLVYEAIVPLASKALKLPQSQLHITPELILSTHHFTNSRISGVSRVGLPLSSRTWIRSAAGSSTWWPPTPLRRKAGHRPSFQRIISWPLQRTRPRS